MDRLKQNKESLTNISSLNPLRAPARRLLVLGSLSRYRSNHARSPVEVSEKGYWFASFLRKKVWANALSNEKGQTLVELMIAMSVMSIGFLGVFAVLSQSLGLNRVVANQYIAANLAAEGIEVVKNIADSNTLQTGGVWNRGLESGDFGVQHDSVALNRDWANQNLKFDLATGIYSYGLGAPTNFRRTVSITNISPAEISVSSTIRWRDRGGTEFEIVLEDRFFNWRSP